MAVWPAVGEGVQPRNGQGCRPQTPGVGDGQVGRQRKKQAECWLGGTLYFTPEPQPRSRGSVARSPGALVGRGLGGLASRLVAVAVALVAVAVAPVAVAMAALALVLVLAGAVALAEAWPVAVAFPGRRILVHLLVGRLGQPGHQDGELLEAQLLVPVRVQVLQDVVYGLVILLLLLWVGRQGGQRRPWPGPGHPAQQMTDGKGAGRPGLWASTRTLRTTSDQCPQLGRC